jgi:hypothetical protein
MESLLVWDVNSYQMIHSINYPGKQQNVPTEGLDVVGNVIAVAGRSNPPSDKQKKVK